MNEEREALIRRILRLPNESFEELAIDVFQFQYRNNPVYKSYLQALDRDIESIQRIKNIPCLPIEFFKTHSIQTQEWQPVRIFQSSGTTDFNRSRHFLREELLYNSLTVKSFEEVYGDINSYCFLALLPHYLEQGQSSLVHMVDHFISCSPYEQSGFYLHNLDDLSEQLIANRERKIPTVLIGVSYALIDLAEYADLDLEGCIVMETGGMKGKREEWDKSKLHDYLSDKFRVPQIHSEYGMTELLSQAYSKKDGIFRESSTMKLVIKEISDPFTEVETDKSGLISVIDLGNIDTCSFIETQDLGRKTDEAHFELMGRLDHADIRGCNLMVL
ncbi:MAG: acyl transferase [Bacteroidia bacterium]|nr:acyl transferase [Bacteroidia bacterium]